MIVAYGQNGEAVRPEQGYPLRLVVPGWEGNVNVKWLHRLHVTGQPAMSRDEAASYTDLLPDGRARQFTFEMDTNSVITRPSGGQRLEGTGFYEISGLAWTGRGKIARVEVSVDGGAWTDSGRYVNRKAAPGDDPHTQSARRGDLVGDLPAAAEPTGAGTAAGRLGVKH